MYFLSAKGIGAR